ncbi:MAG: SHOCT domain-containing protein [Prochlorococcaceae cyanobacterium]
MDQITQEGLQVAQDLGQRHGFSASAVAHMMQAMLRSRGGMAQFNHPEFGGSGQWMPGGMLMIGDMFNNALKSRVDGLCRDVSVALAAHPTATAPVSHSFQHQSGGGFQQQSSHTPTSAYPAMPGAPLFVPDPRDTWWPAELGAPSATGEQNNVRYAYFPNAGRLAVDVNGQVNVYDTGGHHIAGFGQQQGGGGVVFTTPAGNVSLSSFSSAGGFGQQQQSGAGAQQQSSGIAMQPMGGMGMAPMAPMQPMAPQQSWWPAEFGSPTSSGAQNDLRYAIFPAIGRLAVEQGGRYRVFDVGEQVIRGLVLQSGSGALMLVTADGERPLAQFPEVTAGSEPAQCNANQRTAAGGGEADDPYAALERLGELKARGILTEEEFSRKKAELLARL